MDDAATGGFAAAGAVVSFVANQIAEAATMMAAAAAAAGRRLHCFGYCGKGHVAVGVSEGDLPLGRGGAFEFEWFFDGLIVCQRLSSSFADP